MFNFIFTTLFLALCSNQKVYNKNFIFKGNEKTNFNIKILAWNYFNLLLLLLWDNKVAAMYPCLLSCGIAWYTQCIQEKDWGVWSGDDECWKIQLFSIIESSIAGSSRLNHCSWLFSSPLLSLAKPVLSLDKQTLISSQSHRLFWESETKRTEVELWTHFWWVCRSGRDWLSVEVSALLWSRIIHLELSVTELCYMLYIHFLNPEMHVNS